MGVAFVQDLGDSRPDTVWIAEHLVIPEANDVIAFSFDHPRAGGIAFGPMLPTIDLDHHPRAMAREVGGKHP